MSDFVYLFRTSDAEHREHMGTPEQAQLSHEDPPVMESSGKGVGFLDDGAVDDDPPKPPRPAVEFVRASTVEHPESALGVAVPGGQHAVSIHVVPPCPSAPPETSWRAT